MSSLSVVHAVRKNWVHIAIWTAMLTYVGIAPAAYNRFVRRVGKPVALQAQSLPRTGQIPYSIDGLDQIAANDQSLYHLWGWAFFRGDFDQAAYNRFIVLQSGERTYYFEAIGYNRRDVQQLYAHVRMNWVNVGFFADISKDALERGTYRIGILFKQKAGPAAYYRLTNKSLVRTANLLQLIRRK